MKKIRLDVICDSSALQRIHIKYQFLFSLKNNEEIFMNVVCCSCDWRFRVNDDGKNDNNNFDMFSDEHKDELEKATGLKFLRAGIGGKVSYII